MCTFDRLIVNGILQMGGPMKLYSYIVTHDTGFSPNPFWGFCTLADCKPTIRRTASVGDWIVGLSPKADGNRIIYAMRVDEILTYEQYYFDKRFGAKIPDFSKGKIVCKCGDNIYEPLPNGEFLQLRSMHSKENGTEDKEKKAKDLGGVHVLISKTFHYLGSRAPELPDELSELKVGIGHKNRFTRDVISKFLEFIANQPKGVGGAPSKWPRNDQSWRSENE
jgi:hypothetical protein